MKSIWIIGTERYTKTQVEIGIHSKIYIFFFFFFFLVKSLYFSTLTPLPLIITEIMGTPAKPSGKSLTPFQSLNKQISGYPLPRVSISFLPRSQLISRVTGLLDLDSERRELSLKAECGICRPGICEQLTFALRIGSRLWMVSMWTRGWSTLFSSSWLARGDQLVSVIFLRANPFKKGIQIYIAELRD